MLVLHISCRLGVLPLELNRLLIIVVVLSMALTPLLNEVGRKAAEYIETNFEDTPPGAVCGSQQLILQLILLCSH